MELDIERILKRFLKMTDATLSVNVDRGYIDAETRRDGVCISVIVSTKRYNNSYIKTEFYQDNCFTSSDASVVLDERDTLMGVKTGILSYLGLNSELEEYFLELSRKKAEKYFSV